MAMLRKMVRGGYRRKNNSFAFVLSNEDILKKCNVEDLQSFIRRQQRTYVAKVVRKNNESIHKKLLFNDMKQGRQSTVYQNVLKNEKISPKTFHEKAMMKTF